MLVIVQKRGRALIVVGFGLFPFAWLLLVVGQGVYFGPMRSAFAKIGRRYVDDLPYGWGVFDLLFYALPLFGAALVVAGIYLGEERSRRVVYVYGLVGVLLVVGVRMWAPGYL